MRFAEAIDHDRSFVPTRRCLKFFVVTKRLIDFVADQRNVPLRRQFGQRFDFLGSRDITGRIRGTVADDDLRAIGNRGWPGGYLGRH